MTKINPRIRLGKEIQLLKNLVENYKFKYKFRKIVSITDKSKSISRLSNKKLLKLLGECNG